MCVHSFSAEEQKVALHPHSAVSNTVYFHWYEQGPGMDAYGYGEELDSLCLEAAIAIVTALLIRLQSI